jgi:membrane protein YdbS with pleckstrin-like domain
MMNQQIAANDLPSLTSVDLVPISRAYLNIMFLNAVLLFSIPFILLMSFFFFLEPDSDRMYLWMFLVVLILAFAFYCVLAYLGFSKRRYALREHDIIYSKGLLFYKITTVPFVRIQHIEISKSFIARKFNLATLHIYTAGEAGTDLVIKGLPNDTAEKLNAFLSSKINEQL